MNKLQFRFRSTASALASDFDGNEKEIQFSSSPTTWPLSSIPNLVEARIANLSASEHVNIKDTERTRSCKSWKIRIGSFIN